MNKNKVLVGMSGGVDSSVSAFILKKEGYEVHGLFMKNWDDDDGSPYCSIKEDFMDAAFVADQLEIPLFEVNFAKEYKDKGMLAFSNLQQKEMEYQKHGFTTVKHQAEVGVGYFDAISQSVGADSVAALADSTENEQFG